MARGRNRVLVPGLKVTIDRSKMKSAKSWSKLKRGL